MTSTTETARYRQRPNECEAMQWTGSNSDALRAFAGSNFDTIDPEDRIDDPDQDAQLLVEASHWVGIKPTDWVLKFEGYFVAKADETFRAVWEPAVSSSGRAALLHETAAAGLRDRIAEALVRWSYRGKDPEHGGILETVRANAYSRADAVLAVLQTATLRELELLHRPNATPSRPEPRRVAADRAAEVERLQEQLEEAEDTAEQLVRNVQTVARERESYRKAWKDEQQRRAKAEAELRRVAAEEQPAETQDGEFDLRGTAEIRADALDEAATALEAQSCTCGCRRGAEFLRQRSAVIRATAGERPVVGEQPDTQEAVPIHACPPNGSGLTPCCGRTPFEMPGDRMTDDPDKVTCPGSAAP